tara:strand:- start:522 stop:1148 length:627 start_codon:yes stop_codon:yes gene_type:complete
MKLLNPQYWKNKIKKYAQDYYYESLKDKYSNGFFYRELLAIMSKKKVIRSSTQINVVRSVNIVETKIKDIIGLHGEPNYDIIKLNDLNIKVLFYRKHLGKFKAKIEFHIHQNHLFFYSYTFSHLENKERIIKLLKKKYNIKEKINIENKCIIDEKNNAIFIDFNVRFSIYYISHKSRAITDITKHMNEISDQNKTRIEGYYKALFKRI